MKVGRIFILEFVKTSKMSQQICRFLPMPLSVYLKHVLEWLHHVKSWHRAFGNGNRIRILFVDQRGLRSTAADSNVAATSLVRGDGRHPSFQYPSSQFLGGGNNYPPRKLTWNLKINGWKMKFPFKHGPFFRGRVKFSGG